MNVIRSLRTKPARLFAWTKLVLTLIASMLFNPERRDVSLERLTRAVRDLILIRAAELTPLRPQRGAARPSFAPTGFVRVCASPHLRAVAGSALRRRLHGANAAEQLERLFSAMHEIDHLARRIVARLKSGLTRTRTLIVTRPPHHAVRTLATPRVIAADSS